MANDSTTPNSILSLPGRLVDAMRNAVELARLGREEEIARTPFEIALRDPNYRLRHYRAHQADAETTPPVLLVPPLMITAEIYDIAPGSSAVEHLQASGLDPWVVDFGAPEQEEGGLERTLADHILAVSTAIDHIRRGTGRDVHLAGYSQGGIFCYLAAAYRRSEGLSSVITFGSPVNLHNDVLPGVPDEIARPLVETLGRMLSLGFASSAVPAWLTRTTFRMLSPAKELYNQLEFLRSLQDRDALLKKQGQRRFLAEEGWVAWPGPAFREFVEQMVHGNRLFTGGFIVEGRTVTLADITCPVLTFFGHNDEIARAHMVRSLAPAAPRADVFERPVQAGHMGLVVGSRAAAETWPTVAEWIDWREGHAERPASIQHTLSATEAREAGHAGAAVKTDQTATATAGPNKAPGNKTTGNKAPGNEALGNKPTEEDNTSGPLATASALGGDLAHIMVDVFGDGAGAIRTLGANILGQLPRLARLESLRRDTRVGLALTLREQARSNPDSTFFLYEGRAHTYAAADRRVDNIVRGLLSMGVRAGDHVGVLMRTRPSALALAAAVNRLGAVAVLLRPVSRLSDADAPADTTIEGSSADPDRLDNLREEMELAGVEHLVSDPENAAAALATFEGRTWVLGGFGSKDRAIASGAFDLEDVDPDAVEVPAWYEDSPGRSEDVAFILFAGRKKSLRANRITNRRWALSAFGTASASAMTSNDTVYAWTPMQHPTGLLVSVSGAVAAGARLALAQRFTADTFWEEVRRYGATVVFYTGSILRELVDAPAQAAERNHPVRLFAGSGMPRPLWQRVRDRFGTVSVLEFYAATEGNAVLANVSGRKIGCAGRPLPGSADVQLVAWDVDRHRPVIEESGYALEAEAAPGATLREDLPDASGRAPRRQRSDYGGALPGPAGMLLSRVDRERGALAGRPLRNVLSRGDAWHVTGSIFRRDDDGDYWFVDHASDLIRSRTGALASSNIENVISELPGVSIAAAFGMRFHDGAIAETDVDAADRVEHGATVHMGDSDTATGPEKSSPAAHSSKARILDFDVPVVAAVLRPGAKLDPEALIQAVSSKLEPRSRPRAVFLVDSLPTTAGYRTLKAPLRRRSLRDTLAASHGAFYLSNDGLSYKILDESTIHRITT